MAAAGEIIGEAPEIETLVNAAARLLPEQAPLHAFVHHNTLHAFERLSFDDAVIEAGELLGAEPYQTEAAFAAHLASGRIRAEDVRAVLEREGLAGDETLFEGGPTWFGFSAFRLVHLFELPDDPALEWILHEGAHISKTHATVAPERARQLAALAESPVRLEELWHTFVRLAPLAPTTEVGVRWRDRLVALCGQDPDAFVHPLLIRLCAAFLDQGVAYWGMPGREHGFLGAVRRLYGLRLGPPIAWAKGLQRTLATQEREGWSAVRTIEWALDEGGVLEEDRAVFIRDTLLSLRGWAGMMHQMELHPERAPVEALPARLVDHLAVQLLLDLVAARSICDDEGVELRDLDALIGSAPVDRGVDVRVAYEAFVLAQASDVPLSRFEDDEVAAAWLNAVASFDATSRRRLMHLAYERRHRVEVLDSLVVGRDRQIRHPGRRSFQAVFCIDDREESTRRHLEEVDPDVETFGYAGYFGVAMAYQGLDDVRPRALCPVVVSPRHLVREVAVVDDDHHSYARARRRRGLARNASVVGARTLVRGGFISSLLGPFSMVGLVGRTLFPRLAHRFDQRLERVGVTRPTTRLSLLAQSDEETDGSLRSYDETEMADIVENALRTMGLDPGASSLVVVVGHGSSSLNNPHEAAHDCGATAGGRGGPNARAFAAMANHEPVRAILNARGLVIPDATHFLGAYHNTCDDSIVFYDEDLIPESHAGLAEHARDTLHEACRRDAHERCRRFETAPLDIDVEGAFVDAQEHAVDLAQPRPEYGHATNSICFVGRRELTRGLFLDRRAFLVSYDPTQDPDGSLLAPLLLSVGPVGAGISLEYYFSFVDPTVYGCGTKLPHNITGLLGVMNGHASDLRTGLPWQMVEIHEPVRLLIIVDAQRSVLERLLRSHPPLAQLVENRWVQLAAREPSSGEIFVFERGGFEAFESDPVKLRESPDSRAYYTGSRDHLAPVWLRRPESK